MEKYLGKKIRGTHFLYKMDLENMNNFHAYFDQISHIVLVAKMDNGQIIAAYTQPPFQKQLNVDYKPGLMFGVKNQRVFTLKMHPTNKFNKTNPRPITYDEYYIIWGNSDIRIKFGTTELYSGYGTSNCSFEERGNPNQGVADFFMQNDRDAKLITYDIFTV